MLICQRLSLMLFESMGKVQSPYHSLHYLNDFSHLFFQLETPVGSLKQV